MTKLSLWIPAAWRRVLRKLIGRLAHRQIPFLDLQTDELGLRLRAVGPAQAFEYSLSGIYPCFNAPLPLALLDLLGNRDQPVELSQPRADTLLAQWHDRDIPRSQEFSIPAERKTPPALSLPVSWGENPPELLAALRDAFATTDATSTRYAMQCIQLRGTDHGDSPSKPMICPKCAQRLSASTNRPRDERSSNTRDPKWCSTPFGINEQTTELSRFSAAQSPSAQRLSASTNRPLGKMLGDHEVNKVLNAFRHQRTDHSLRRDSDAKLRTVLNAFRHQRTDHCMRTRNGQVLV